MKLATTTGDFGGYTNSQIQALRYVREAGFQYADYNFGMDYKHRNGVYSEHYEEYFAQVNAAAAEIGVRLIQAHAPMGTPLNDPDGSFLADTLRCVDACGAWGIPNLVVHSGYAHGLTVEQTFDANKAFFMPLLERAEQYGVNILVENFNKMSVPGLYWIDNATDLLGLIEYVNHPLFHAVWDAGHANLQEMPQDEELRLLGSHVRALHIQDNRGDHDAHLLPFLGTMSMDAVMHGLLDIGYEGYFTFEVGGIFSTAEQKRPFAKDSRLAKAPLSLRLAADRYMYELGKCVLTEYGCFEE
ncbi:MAG: sugar phosphate isomerase/epimerase [Clostridia bacterium]|jgi:sugar phosphate isomerase/epimerase|nr:sugar phosphate isomerase/epimerase [Clostridia bacterium]MBQ2256046.1 sugar phosphate isomerase/epimerase [Clostridia bacterium]MBQ5793449.1 sugar phosphate isomerase/epimerase [Clostridia bacterium]